MIRDLSLTDIVRNERQPREQFPEDHIKRLASSIKKRGLIQPITVRPIAHDKYMIVAGECRYRAHLCLGVKTIRAIIEDVDEKEMTLRAIIENVQRRDMNPIEEAKAFQNLVDCGLSILDIVEELGLESQGIVRQRLVLLNLTPEIQKLVACGQLPPGMAFGVAQVSAHHQSLLMKQISSGALRTAEQVRHAGIALREAESQLDAFGDQSPKAHPKEIASVSRLEGKISQIADMVQSGFKDGECVIAQRVAPDRVRVMADKLTFIRKHILDMEHQLRRVVAQGEILMASACKR